MRVRTVAPAKINWTLEVLGKRDDGYHEIRSVMQTIDLCDEISVEEGDRTLLSAEGYEPDGEDLALRAVRALEEATGRELPVSIRLVKRIPVAAGLGGGSSDAAAVLRAVDRQSRRPFPTGFGYGLGLSPERLAGAGARVGSDVPFFLGGGTAVAEGRGERMTQLSDPETAWLVVLAPPIYVGEKTKRMYEALSSAFSDGARTQALVERLAREEPVRDEDICNAFEQAAYQAFDRLTAYRDELIKGGAKAVHLSGTGPALFALFPSRDESQAVAGALSASNARVFVARTMGAEEATRVVVE